MVQAVGVDKYGIGYSGVGYLTPDVKAVSLVQEVWRVYVEATHGKRHVVQVSFGSSLCF